MKRILTIIMLFAAGTQCAFAASLPTIAERYQKGETLKVLIVPGHDNEFSGARYRDMREADANLALANDLAKALSSDPKLSVTVTRDAQTGNYLPELARYFTKNEKKIATWIAEHKKDYLREERRRARARGDEPAPEQVPHSNANDKTVTRLYGINKWASEKDYDLAIHIHFNDYWPRSTNGTGEFGGYTVYVPGEPLPNAHKADAVGDSIGARLGDVVMKSTQSMEMKLADKFGTVADTKLIALGSYGTLKIPSVLVEYSYIYEPHAYTGAWGVTMPAMARATALGLTDYLSGQKAGVPTFKHAWNADLNESVTFSPDTLALQYALRGLELYPPAGKTATDCPMTGTYGPCTKASVAAFQAQKGLPADGVFTTATRGLLNSIFSE